MSFLGKEMIGQDYRIIDTSNPFNGKMGELLETDNDIWCLWINGIGRVQVHSQKLMATQEIG